MTRHMLGKNSVGIILKDLAKISGTTNCQSNTPEIKKAVPSGIRLIKFPRTKTTEAGTERKPS